MWCGVLLDDGRRPESDGMGKSMRVCFRGRRCRGGIVYEPLCVLQEALANAPSLVRAELRAAGRSFLSKEKAREGGSPKRKNERAPKSANVTFSSIDETARGT